MTNPKIPPPPCGGGLGRGVTFIASGAPQGMMSNLQTSPPVTDELLAEIVTRILAVGSPERARPSQTR